MSMLAGITSNVLLEMAERISIIMFYKLMQESASAV
jgi:hypothetical protein